MSGATGDGKAILEAALVYAERGWPVFPVYEPNGRGCSCGHQECAHVGKHPRTAHGFYDATTDPKVIRKWWQLWPNASVAIRTGRESGLVDVEVDGAEGCATLAKLTTRHGPLPDTLQAVSTRGPHFFFAHPGGELQSSAGKLGPGLDVRADGGYVIVPPSRHESGMLRYWAREVPTAAPPDWLVAALKACKPQDPSSSASASAIPKGQRNTALTRLAGVMRRQGMSKDAILAALKAENQTRCQPPLPEAEVAAVAASIARHPPRPAIITELGIVKQLADEIMLTEHFAQDPGGKIYRFNGGVYKQDGSAHVKRLVKALLECWALSKRWSSARSEEVVEYIRVDSPSLWAQPPLNVVNVQNGLLDLESGQLNPHSPKHLCSVQVPVVYDPAATCPEWERFVEEVFPKDALDLAWQIIGWLARPDVSLQKAILLLGEGGNGKSTYLAGVTAFLGSSNVSALSLHKLESDRFAAARLVGKLANICPDLPSSHLMGTSVFKALTGGDAVLAEYKYRDSFEFVPFARLVFSANHAPRSSDSSQAFFRRWDVVPFTRTFEGGDVIPRLEMDARLAKPIELSGVLNKALVALKQIQECKGLIESASMSAAQDEFRKVTDPLAVWLDSRTIEKSGAFVTKNDLLKAYNAQAAVGGRPPMTTTGFGLALRRLRPNLKDCQRTIAGKVEWVWLGLGLRSSED